MVQKLKVLGQHHELRLSDDHEVLEVTGGPHDLLDHGAFGETELVKSLSRGEIIHEDCVIRMHDDFPHGSWIDHLDPGESFLVERDLLDVGPIEVADRNLPVHVENTNPVLRYEDGCQSVISSLLERALDLLEILLEIVNYEARVLSIKVEDQVVGVGVVVIVVHALRLVEQHLLAIRVHARQQGLLLQRQIVDVEVLVLHEEDVGAGPLRGVSLPFKLEYTHSVVVAGSEVVQRWMSSQNPVAIRVAPRLVQLHPSIQIPQPQRLVF